VRPAERGSKRKSRELAKTERGRRPFKPQTALLR
jgi:hypothetical protein